MPEEDVRPVVILVHGLWYRSTGMKLLGARLRRRGYDTRLFDYSSVTAPMQQHSESLRRAVERERGREVFLVGHSMGGLLILQMLNEYPELSVSRAVLLGSPVQGSTVARRLSRRWWGQWLVGTNAGLLGQGVRAPKQTQIGILAGNRNVGVGRVLGGVGGQGDGTVAVRETRLEGAHDHVVLPVTHTGMVVSSAVAKQVDHFLLNGRFNPPQADQGSSVAEA